MKPTNVSLGLAWLVPLLFAVTVLAGELPAAPVKSADADAAVAEMPPAGPSDSASAGASPVDSPPDVPQVLVARVGSSEIYAADLLEFAVSTNDINEMGSPEGRSAVLYKLIATHMLYQAARDEELVTAHSSEQELAKAVAEIQRRHFPPPPLPSEEEAAAYFESHKDRYGIPTHVRLRQILVAVPPDVSPEVKADRRARIEEAYRRLKSGADFAAVAAEMTDNPDAKARGGDLGFIPLLPGEKGADVIGVLAVGEYTEILETGRGYQILQLVDNRPPIYPSFDTVSREIRNELGRTEFNRRRSEYLKALAGKMEITILLPEYQDAHPLQRSGSDADIIY